MDRSFEERYFSGREVYGEDLDPAAVARWYREEEEGYYAITQARSAYEYADHALNEFYAYRFLRGRRFDCCLAVGCARGDDVAPLAGQVGRFLAIEPVREWWSDSIAGTPARFLKPRTGDLPVESEAADLAVCLGVLHHIPNAGHVIGEVARVLRPGGLFVLREPIQTLGDWRGPRRGLTRNERGFPLSWLDRRLAEAGFRPLRRTLCRFPLIPRVARLLGLRTPYNRRWLVAADRLASAATAWNLHYHRDTLLKKLAPGAVFYLLERAAAPAEGAPRSVDPRQR
ncbi:MAG: methyltransferase domain-containing protein [Rhodospirillaceae bacterium]|nr:methyltransferase domain-containing protein [Rhodospirillaceae bacterium]